MDDFIAKPVRVRELDQLLLRHLTPTPSGGGSGGAPHLATRALGSSALGRALAAPPQRPPVPDAEARAGARRRRARRVGRAPHHLRPGNHLGGRRRDRRRPRPARARRSLTSRASSAITVSGARAGAHAELHPPAPAWGASAKRARLGAGTRPRARARAVPQLRRA